MRCPELQSPKSFVTLVIPTSCPPAVASRRAEHVFQFELVPRWREQCPAWSASVRATIVLQLPTRPATAHWSRPSTHRLWQRTATATVYRLSSSGPSARPPKPATTTATAVYWFPAKPANATAAGISYRPGTATSITTEDGANLFSDRSIFSRICCVSYPSSSASSRGLENTQDTTFFPDSSRSGEVRAAFQVGRW